MGDEEDEHNYFFISVYSKTIYLNKEIFSCDDFANIVLYANVPSRAKRTKMSNSKWKNWFSINCMPYKGIKSDKFFFLSVAFSDNYDLV